MERRNGHGQSGKRGETTTMSQTTDNAQRGATASRRSDSTAPDFPTASQRSSWAVFLRGLEASHRLNFVPTGSKLEKGRVYIDLRQPCRGAFRALQG